MALTAKRQKFVREYLKDGNATQAAIRAGYSPKTATSQGSELLTFPEVKEAVSKTSTKVNEKIEISVEKVRQRMAEIAFSDHKDCTRALDMLAKVLSMYTEHVEISHKLSDEERATRLNEILAEAEAAE